MELVAGNERRGKLIICSLLALVVLLFVGIFKLLTGSLLVGLLLFLALMWFTLRTVGAYVMYPGSSFFTRSDMEIRTSKEISSRMVLFFNSVHFLHMCVAQKKYLSHQNQYDLVVVILQHIRTMTEVLQMFEDTLSPRKVKMLQHYRTITTILEEKEETDPFCIEEIVHKPRIVDSLDDSMSLHFRQKFERIEAEMKELHGLIKSYSPPNGTFSHLKFRMFE
jgi:hypothetical protein